MRILSALLTLATVAISPVAAAQMHMQADAPRFDEVFVYELALVEVMPTITYTIIDTRGFIIGTVVVDETYISVGNMKVVYTTSETILYDACGLPVSTGVITEVQWI